MSQRVAVVAAVTACATVMAIGVAAQQPPAPAAITPPVITVPSGSADVEQTTAGARPPAEIAASFDGLGETFQGPQGTASLRDPSDNSIAVGPNHIVVTVNSRIT